MKGSYICGECGKSLASSQSLWNHKQRCKCTAVQRPFNSSNWSQRSADLFRAPSQSKAIDSYPKSDDVIPVPPKNPNNSKLTPFINSLINEGIEMKKTEESKSAATQRKLQLVKEKPVSAVPPKKVLPPTTKAKKLHLQRKVIEKPQEVDDELISFTPMKLEAAHGDVPRLRAVDFVTKPSRTKDDILRNADIVRSGDDDTDDDDDDYSLPPPSSRIKFLPSTLDGLSSRFNKLFCKFRRENQHQYRNELVSILDELLNLGGITRHEYKTLNGLLAQSLGSGMDVEDEEGEEAGSADESKDDTSSDEIVLPDTLEGIRSRFNELYIEFLREKKYEHVHELHLLLDEMLRQNDITPADYVRLNTDLSKYDDLEIDEGEENDEDEEEEEEETINSTIHYLIQNDREELEEILDAIKEIDEFKDDVLEFEELLQAFWTKEYLDSDEAIRPKLDDLLRRLEASNRLPKSKLFRIKMLLDDIAENRYRIKQLIERLVDADDKEHLSLILNALVHEELISEEQLTELSQMEFPLDLEKIKEVITQTKIGQGVKFLPTTITDLRRSLYTLLKDLSDEGGNMIKAKISAILEELFRRNVIRDAEYQNLKALL